MLIRMTFAAVIVMVALSGGAQEIDAEVEKFGPAFFNKDQVEIVQEKLAWQLKVRRAQQQQLRRLAAEWEERYDALARKSMEIQGALESLGAFEKASASFADERAQLQLMLVDLQAERNQLTNKLKTQKKVAEAEHKKDEIAVRRSQVELKAAENELKQMQELTKKAMVSKRETDVAAMKVELARLRLDGLMLDREVREEAMTIDLSSQLQALAAQELALKERQGALEKKRAQVSQLRKELDQDRLNFEKQLALKMLEMARTRELELELENASQEAMLQLLQEHRKLQAEEKPNE